MSHAHHYLRGGLISLLVLLAAGVWAGNRPPNVVFILPDQWRAEACGYAGNPDVKTPQIDRLAQASIRFVNAVSGVPVCCPARASLLTGQRVLTHGVFMNDAPLSPEAVTLGKVGDGFAITRIALTTTASVPGASQEAFAKAAADAKGGCPISKLFANNTEILLDAKLV